MPTQCSADLFGFAPVERRRLEAAFDGGAVTSDAGALLLGATERAINLVGRFARCFTDGRRSDLIEHDVATLVGQRVFGIELGYEDLNEHDVLRHDPAMAVLAGKLKAKRSDCAPLAGKSTLNRLELSRPEPTRYHKIAFNGEAIEDLFVRLFLEAHRTPPRQIILDLDATDDPLHGHQEGRFFHGYYDCYCYLPLYVFCGRHLLCAKLRRSNIDGSAGAIEEVAPHHRPDPSQLAAGAHPAAGRLRLRPGGADGLVRAAPGRLRVRAGPQRPPRGQDRARAGAGQAPGAGQRSAGAVLQGLPLDDAGLVVAPAAGGCQGGVDARQGQPALRRHLAQAEGG